MERLNYNDQNYMMILQNYTMILEQYMMILQHYLLILCLIQCMLLL